MDISGKYSTVKPHVQRAEVTFNQDRCANLKLQLIELRLRQEGYMSPGISAQVGWAAQRRIF